MTIPAQPQMTKAVRHNHTFLMISYYFFYYVLPDMSKDKVSYLTQFKSKLVT